MPQDKQTESKPNKKVKAAAKRPKIEPQLAPITVSDNSGRSRSQDSEQFVDGADPDYNPKDVHMRASSWDLKSKGSETINRRRRRKSARER